MIKAKHAKSGSQVGSLAKAASCEPALDRAPAAPTLLDRVLLDRVSLDVVSLDVAPIDGASIDQAFLGRVSLYRIVLERARIGSTLKTARLNKANASCRTKSYFACLAWSEPMGKLLQNFLTRGARLAGHEPSRQATYLRRSHRVARDQVVPRCWGQGQCMAGCGQ